MGTATGRCAVDARRRLLPYRRGQARAGGSAHRPRAGQERRLLPALGPAQPATRLQPRAHAPRSSEPLPRLVAHRPAAFVRAPRPPRARVALLSAAVRLEDARAPHARELLLRRGRQRPEPLGGSVPRCGPAARHPGRGLRRELGPHRRQGDRLPARGALRRPERRDAERPRAVPRSRSRARDRHRLAADGRLPRPAASFGIRRRSS